MTKKLNPPAIQATRIDEPREALNCLFTLLQIVNDLSRRVAALEAGRSARQKDKSCPSCQSDSIFTGPPPWKCCHCDYEGAPAEFMR